MLGAQPSEHNTKHNLSCTRGSHTHLTRGMHVYVRGCVRNPNSCAPSIFESKSDPFSWIATFLLSLPPPTTPHPLTPPLTTTPLSPGLPFLSLLVLPRLPKNYHHRHPPGFVLAVRLITRLWSHRFFRGKENRKRKKYNWTHQWVESRQYLIPVPVCIFFSFLLLIRANK